MQKHHSKTSSYLILGFILSFISLNIIDAQSPKAFRNDATEILYNNLKALVNNGKIMFGQANGTSITYLETNRHTDMTRNDCKDITGTDPAFIESDFMWYADNPEFMKRDIQAMHLARDRGAVIGYCWHLTGMNSQSFYSKVNNKMTTDSKLVKDIISNPDRTNNPSLNWLLTQYDSLAIPVFRELNCPIIFRPFHEMNGNWFWWGSDNCTPKEYQQLYRIVVDYLRSKKIDNLLFVWSPDKIANFDYFPGDEYVDILGLDIYEPGIMQYSNHHLMLSNIGKIVDYANTHLKVAALTETGLRKDDNGNFRYPDLYPDFWTKYVLTPIINDPKAHHIAWIMSWYGADWHGDQSTEAYIPYLGMKRPRSQEAIDDFRAFYLHPATVFNDSIPKMYEKH